MDVTYNFTAGTRAVADQVDQNFADVKAAVDPLQTDVAEIQSTLTSGIILPDGSVDFTRLQSYKTYVVSNATNATPIVITAVAHSFLTGDKVFITGVGGNAAANGIFTITKLGVDTFRLNDSAGNGAFSSNGSALIYQAADNNIASVAYVKNNAGLTNDNKGTITTNITLAENKLTTGYFTGTNTITLPTITDTNKQVTCELWFTTATTGQPTITNTNLKWAAEDGGKAPSSYSILSGIVNVLIFKSYFEGATQKWAAEYTTFGGVETAFAQPTLNANGTIGGTSFAVSSTSVFNASFDIWRGFDNNASSYFFGADGTYPQIVMYNPNALKVSSISMTNTPTGSYELATGSVYGSTDGVAYTFLNTFTSTNVAANANWILPVANGGNFYKYHKIVTSTYSGNSAGFNQATINGVYIAT